MNLYKLQPGECIVSDAASNVKCSADDKDRL